MSKLQISNSYQSQITIVTVIKSKMLNKWQNENTNIKKLLQLGKKYQALWEGKKKSP